MHTKKVEQTGAVTPMTRISAEGFLKLLDEKKGDLQKLKNFEVEGAVAFKGYYPYAIQLGEIQFLHEVCCKEANFGGEFHCGKAQFKGIFAFNDAIFHQRFCYGKATFHKKVSYGCSYFSSVIDYADAVFLDEIDHEKAIFNIASIELGKVKFHQKTYCRNHPLLAQKLLHT